LVKEVRLQRASLTLRRRRDVLFTSRDDEQRAAEGARIFLAEKFSWEHDRQIMAELCVLLELREDDASATWKIERAVESGELLTIPDRTVNSTSVRQSGGAPVLPSRLTGFARTPSQLFGRAAGALTSIRSFERPTLPRLLAEDMPAIFAANPGDVLPDGSIATPPDWSRSRFAGALPFEYVPDALGDNVMELAARTNDPDYAAKMLGYDRDIFGDMIHAMKAENQLRGNDNVIWHDNGDVYFKDIKIDNMHNY
jgi:hypothetical protein